MIEVKKGDTVLDIYGNIRTITGIANNKDKNIYLFDTTISFGHTNRNYIYEDEVKKILVETPIIEQIIELNNQTNLLLGKLKQIEIGG